MSLENLSTISLVHNSQCWPQSLCFSPDGQWLALGTSLGDILIYSTSLHIPPHYHLSVDNDVYNAVAITVVDWQAFEWLDGSTLRRKMGAGAGIVAAFEDGHIRIVE